MPTVGKKKYPYTTAGKAAAKKAARGLLAGGAAAAGAKRKSAKKAKVTPRVSATKKPGGVKAAAPGKKKGLAVKRGKDGKLTLKVSPKYSISLYKDAQKSAKKRSEKAKRTRERARRS